MSYQDFIDSGNNFRAKGNNKQALECYEKAIEKYPDNLGGYIDASIELRELQNFQRAKYYLKQVLQKEPNNFRALIHFGINSHREGNLAEAVVYLEKATNSHKVPSYVYIELSTILIKLQRLEDAEDTLNRLLNHDPKNLSGLIKLGNIFRIKGQYDKATELFKEVIEKHPDNLNLYVDVAIALREMRQLENSKYYLKEVLKKERSHLRALIHLGLTYQKEVNRNEARKYFEQVLSRDTSEGIPDYLYIQLAIILIELEDFGKTQIVVSKFLDQHPGKEEGLVRIGEAYKKQGYPNKALELFKQLIEKKPHLLNVYAKVAEELINLKQFENAKYYLSQVLDKNPNYLSAVTEMIRLEYKMKNYSRALLILDRVLPNNKNDFNLYMYGALIHRQLGSLGVAENYFKSAIEILQNSSDLFSKESSLALKFLKTFGCNSYKFTRFLIASPRKNYILDVSDVLASMVPSKISILNQMDYSFCFNELCKGLSFNEEVREICDWEMIVNGPSSWYHTNLGHFYYQRGNLEYADAQYLKARDLAIVESQNSQVKYNSLSKHICGIFTWQSRKTCKYLFETDIKDIDNELKTKRKVYELSSKKLNQRVKCVHLVGCDSKYFHNFISQLLIMNQKNDAMEIGVVTHCHLVNPSSIDIEKLEALSSKYGELFFYSYELVPQEYFEVSYFTCLRFLVLNEILQIYQAPVLVTDIDACVKFSWKTIVNKFQGIDLAFSATGANPLQNKGIPFFIGAGASYVKNNDLGLKFSSFLKKYIIYSYKTQNLTNWCIDQVALRQAIIYISSKLNISSYNITGFYSIGNPVLFANAYPSKEEFVKKVMS